MKSLLILGMLLPVVTFASVGTRGGGNARVCFTNAEAAKAAKLKPLDREVYWESIASIEVLDLFEARLPRGDMGESMKIMEAKPKESASAFGERVAKRFDRRFPSFANLIREGKNSFTQAQIIWSTEAFGKTDDIDPALHFESKLCSILGLAFQKNVNGQEKLFIDQHLFLHPKHGQLSRNVTFLHEYIYRYARVNRNHETSAATREAVGFAIALSPNQVDDLDVDALGLSVRSIGQALLKSELIVMTSMFSNVDGAYADLQKLLEAQKDFTEAQSMLTEHPTAVGIIRGLNEFAKQHPWIHSYTKLLNRSYGACREEIGLPAYSRSMDGCYEIFKDERIANNMNPKELAAFKQLSARFDAFIKNDTQEYAKEVIFPKLQKNITARLVKLKMSAEEIETYLELINDKMLETISYSLKLETRAERVNDFVKYTASSFIEASNKKASADMPL